MSDPVNLTADQSPVSAVRVGPTKAAKPHLAVVYATPGQVVDCFEGRPLTPGQQLVSKYRMRYEVDMREYRRTAVLGSSPLVSRDQVHDFEVSVSFAFRVDGWRGAEQWVRSGLVDALPAVHGHIIRLFHGVGRAFDINDSFGLQDRLNQLCGTPVSLAEGLLLYDCRVTVRPDARSREFLTALVEAQRREALGLADHVPGMGATLRELEIEAARQQGAIAARQREADSIEDVPMTVEGLIRAYMIENPGDRAGAVVMLTRLREAETAAIEAREGKIQDLFQLMIDKKLIRPGQLNSVAEEVIQQMRGGSQPAAPPPAIGASTPPPIAAAPYPARPAAPYPSAPAGPPYPSAPYPPAPYPPAPAASYPPASYPPAASPYPSAGPAQAAPASASYTPTQVQPTVSSAPSAFTGAALVYLVLDESLEPRILEEVNRGLRALHDALSANPEVSAALRLCVVGMAGDAQVRLELDTVVPSTRTPILIHRQGRSYQQTFRILRAILPQDVMLVKSQRVAVLRPMVFFLSGGVPDEGDVWLDSYQELVDPARHPSAPHVVACGMGTAEAGAIRRIATQPAFGYMAAPHTDSDSAAHNFAGFLRDSVIDYGRRLAGGVTQFNIVGPDGFRSADDSI